MLTNQNIRNIRNYYFLFINALPGPCFKETPELYLEITQA